MSATTLAEPPPTTAAAAIPLLRPRLALLLFILYSVAGSWMPLFSLYLKDLGFSPVEIGWCCATNALGCLVAPLIAGQVADRWLAAERCVCLCGFTAGVLLWLLPGVTDPLAVFWLSFAAWAVLVPAITLSASLSFAQLPNPQRDYGSVRLWGTIGWLTPGLVFALWFAWDDRDRADIFRLASVMSFALAGYALTLPHTPPTNRPRSSPLAPLVALRLLRDRSLAIYFVASVGLYVTIAFSSQVTPILLAHLGVPRHGIAAALTLSQVVEVVTLSLLPLLLLRFGLRGTMLFGMTAWILALVVLTLGQPLWLLVASLGFYGIYVGCFLVTGQLFFNGRAPRDVRASAQGLLTFGNGIGQLFGHVLVGFLRHLFDGAFAPTFATALILGAVLWLVFVVGIRTRKEPDAEEGLAKPTLNVYGARMKGCRAS